MTFRKYIDKLNIFSANPCAQNGSACMNGGTCLINAGSAECCCLPGFTGQNCETKGKIARIW